MNTSIPSRKERALELLRANRLEEAKVLCEEVCRTENQPGAWYLLGIVHGRLGDLAQAESSYRKAIEIKPDYADAHSGLGIVLNKLGQPENAAAALRRAAHLKPADPEAHFYLGVVLAGSGQLDNGINLGHALLDLGRIAEAIDVYRIALRTDPDHPVVLADLGVALALQNNHDEATACYLRVLEINPEDAETHYNLGNTLRATGKPEKAIESYRAAIRLRPADADAHVNLGLVHLSLGNFRDGWKEYDWQWRREGAPVRPFPPTPWEGTDLGGKDVFLHDEQGLGDELFFLRFVPRLRRKGAGRIVYRASSKVTSLLTRTPIIDEVLAVETRPAEGALVFSVGDLPRLLGMERTDQAPSAVTLTPLPAHVEALRRHLTALGSPPYLGITWRGGTTKKNALYKEIPLAKLATGFRNTHATMVILQRNPLPHEVEAFSQTLGRPVHDFSVLNENLEQMLALLAVIDDYVGVSNANMHLRAAVGRTARVLVPAPPEWRWMAEGRESPWFPGFSVYRQGYDGNWDGALRELENDLRRSLAE